jgi:quercetin dioxygenase-like cupin family protein
MDNYNWDRVPVEQLMPGISRQVVHTPSMTILRIELNRGALVATHSHFHEQVSMLMKGKVRFELDGEEIRLQAGDILRIPSNALHSAEALEDAVLIDVFTPARTD